MEKQRRGFVIANALLSVGVVGVTLWGLYNRQAVIDWWRLQTYKPPAEVTQLADNTTMTDQGRHLFFASEPSIETGTAFSSDCNNNNEQTIVLGCYRAQLIYLFDVTDARLNGVKEVTAAHEMLHAAYERLSTSERQHVDAMVAAQLKTVTDTRILALIDLYNKQEPGELYNEMHSILGTEYRSLSPELETYYGRYFSDRKKIVTYSENYEAVFTASRQQIATMDNQLSTWEKQINSNNMALDQQQSQLASESQQLDQLRSAGNADDYDLAVADYNQKVRAFNSLVEQTKQLLTEYNNLVITRNNEAAAQNNLSQSLDSRHQTVPTN